MQLWRADQQKFLNGRTGQPHTGTAIAFFSELTLEVCNYLSIYLIFFQYDYASIVSWLCKMSTQAGS